MSRARNQHSPGISLFPCLAVLICTMGALIVLLIVVARVSRLQAAQATGTSALEIQADKEVLELRISQLQESRQKTAAQLEEERLRLSGVEDHLRRLREQFKQMKAAATDLERSADPNGVERQTAAAELARMQAAITQSQQDLEAARRAVDSHPRSFAIIPYVGPNRTRRRPFYVECTAEAIILQPEGIRLSDKDFPDASWSGNPLAVAMRAAREYIADRDPAAVQGTGEPYPLLLVRPDGIPAYYIAREAMSSWGSDFGYELIGADWPLEFPPADPQLAKVQEQAINEARMRQQMLARVAPRRPDEEERPTYTVSPSGGLTRDGGPSLYDTGRPSSDMSGGGPGGRGGSGFGGSGFGKSGKGSGDGSGSGRPGGGGAGGNDSALAGNGYGGSGGGSALDGSGGGAAGPGGPGTGGGFGSGTGGAGSSFGGSGLGGSGNGSAQSGSSGNGAGTGGGAASGGGAKSGTAMSGGAAGSGQPGGFGFGSGGGPNGLPNGASNGASGAPNGPNGTASGAGGSRSNKSGGAPNGAQGSRNGPGGTPITAGEAMANGWDTTSSSGGGSGQGGVPSSSRHGDSSASDPMLQTIPGDNGEQGPPLFTPSPGNPPEKNKKRPLAESRGTNWALGNPGPRSVPVTRPIRVRCEGERLLVMADPSGQNPRAIILPRRTEDSIDELVGVMRTEMKNWGIAGNGMYWRPVLVLELGESGEGRIADLQALFQDSGFDVKRK